MPAFAKEQLGSGASEVGLLLLGSGIGALIGSMTLTLMHRAWLYRWLLFCIVTFAVLLTLFAWSGSLDDLTGTSWGGWFWVTWVFTMLVGVVAIGWVWPLTTTIMQLSSPAEVRGRVLGVLHFVPRLPLPGGLAPDAGRHRSGLAAGDNRGGGGDPAGGAHLRPGPQGRPGTGDAPGGGVKN